MLSRESADLQHALDDFALNSGYLIVVRLDANGIVLGFNRGFESSVRPAGDPRGRPFSDFVSTPEGHPPDIEPGLPKGAPVPYPLRAWGGQDLLLHAYPAADAQALLIGSPTSADDTQGIQRMSRLTTEMGNLVRELRRANQRIQEIANHDGLTGLANRRHFLEHLRIALRHAQRHDRPLSVLMADLDRFKEVNDKFGHAGGDAVLASFASLLKQDARASDLAGRLGGEEFAIMLPETNGDQAFDVAERLRTKMVAQYPLGPQHRFTVSIGIAVLRKEDSLDDLLERADQALYAAKGAGRNRVSADCSRELSSGGRQTRLLPMVHR